ncbi:hypothetical protein ACFFJI_12630 [Allobacillus sp. GCM10007491]|uniref:Uncharacterized protein n=2 Tax=Allobacillus TaxID=1400133 RepID=A0A941HUE4_9BACI|nr:MULTISPECIES: hypothetical protein [Allobacillus]MBR7554800.1 hypothetical protein [Allobacillus saliphilus]TSJ65848.1 hypothetical protein FPQ13_05945 [Allobacillus salarius]
MKRKSSDHIFTLDISHKGHQDLSKLYDKNGLLKQPVQGEVLAVSSLYPIVTHLSDNNYDLLIMQRIIGTSNADTWGYVENLLTWNGTHFVSALQQ